MYNAVDIDVAKRKSTVTFLQPGGTVIRKPFDVSHTSQNLNELAKYLVTLFLNHLSLSEFINVCNYPTAPFLFNVQQSRSITCKIDNFIVFIKSRDPIGYPDMSCISV